MIIYEEEQDELVAQTQHKAAESEGQSSVLVPSVQHEHGG